MSLVKNLEKQKSDKVTHIFLKDLKSCALANKVIPSNEQLGACKKRAKLVCSEQNGQMKFYQLTISAAIKIASEWSKEEGSEEEE